MSWGFGKVCTDNRPGRRPTVYIDCRIDGKRYKLIGPRSRDGVVMPFRDTEIAGKVLASIRTAIEYGKSPLQACAELLPHGLGEVSVRFNYERFLEAKDRERRAGQLSTQRVACLRAHLTQGRLDPLADLSIFSVTHGELCDWKDHLLKTTALSANSIRHILVDIGAFFRWLEGREEIARAPKLPTVSVPEYVAKIPPPGVVDRILAAIPWPRRGLFLCRAYMGLRPSEAGRADLADWRFGDEDSLRVHGKGGRGRIVPAHPEVSRWVREHHPAQNIHDPDKPVVLFPNPWGRSTDRRWSGEAARRTIYRAMREVGVDYKANEAMRHAFGTELATRLLDSGSQADASRLVMSLMGHTDEKTSRRYVKLATGNMGHVIRGRDD
jgi:integrase